jgi:signal transduction histidine kinase
MLPRLSARMTCWLLAGPEVPVILAAHTYMPRSMKGSLTRGLVTRLRRLLTHSREAGPSAEDALVRAMCHDMRGSLTCLESALHQLDHAGPGRLDLLSLARAQAAHLTSMLRTAEAARGTPPQDPSAWRRLRDVVAASVAASGLPRRQLTLRLGGCVGDVLVGDCRLQRILVNLLENAHRHGGGEPVELAASCGRGWVELAVTQPGVPAAVVAGHLRRTRPPADLTGLGLWSVQRQAHELGGRVLCEDGDGALTVRVQLPDR